MAKNKDKDKIVDRQRIANDKTRITTYEKRKGCLYRKAWEFSTLCGVQICFIVYGPTKATDEVVSEPEIWPKDETKARDIIRRYRDSVSNSCRKEAHVENFVNDIGKAKGMENNNKRVKRNSNKYFSWDEKLDKCSQEQLCGIFDAVTNKLQEAILKQDRMIRAHHQAMETPIPQILMDPHYMSQYFAEQQQQMMFPNYNNLGFSLFPSHDDPIQIDPNLMENLTDLGLTQGLMMSKGNDGTHQFMQRQAPYYNLEPVVPRSAAFNPFPGYQGSFNIPWRLPGNQVGGWDFLEKKTI